MCNFIKKSFSLALRGCMYILGVALIAVILKPFMVNEEIHLKYIYHVDDYYMRELRYNKDCYVSKDETGGFESFKCIYHNDYFDFSDYQHLGGNNIKSVVMYYFSSNNHPVVKNANEEDDHILQQSMKNYEERIFENIFD